MIQNIPALLARYANEVGSAVSRAIIAEAELEETKAALANAEKTIESLSGRISSLEDVLIDSGEALESVDV